MRYEIKRAHAYIDQILIMYLADCTADTVADRIRIVKKVGSGLNIQIRNLSKTLIKILINQTYIKVSKYLESWIRFRKGSRKNKKLFF